MPCSEVVFQHGLCGDTGQPAEVFPSDTGFRLVTMECRGHGQSPAGDFAELSIATFTDDLASFIEERQLAPAIVGGISMGAAIALRLAVRRPDLVSGLILARPAWVAEAGPPNLRAMEIVGRLLSEHPPEEALRLFEQSEIPAEFGGSAPDNLATLRGLFAREPQAVTAALLARISADGPGVEREQIARLEVPTLVIGHERDLIHPFGYAQTLAGLIPGAILYKITPKADDLDRYRQEFRDCLRSFLDSAANAITYKCGFE